MGRLIILSLLLIGCAPYYVDPRGIRGIDPSFEYEVRLFESLYGQRIKDPAIGFGNLPLPQVGRCAMYSTGHWEITVDKTYWSRVSKEARLGLVLHELGHCVLKRPHDNNVVITQGNYQVPKSLMYPYNFYDDGYSFMETYYFKELFNPATPIINTKTVVIIDYME